MNTLRLVLLAVLCNPLGAAPRVAFIDPTLPSLPPDRNAAALAFATAQGPVTRLRWVDRGGWEDPERALHAPEEFALVWYHQGDRPDLVRLTPAAVADLADYLEGGGVLLLSGAAGALVLELGIESTVPRVLPATSVPFASGVRVPPKHAGHPIFAGLDTKQPIVFTSLGGNALADFYGTDGPHGELLAEGNAGVGERPLVEYRLGAGRVIFVGWRLADFTTAGDAHRPHLERFFSNLFAYLAGANANRARLARPTGKLRYQRVCGVPFLRGEQPAELTLSADGAAGLVRLLPRDPGGALAVDGAFVQEAPDAAASLPCLALTATGRAQPVAAWRARRQAEQAADDQRDAAKLAGLEVIRPAVRTLPGPLQPLRQPRVDQSVLFGRSHFMAPGNGYGDAQPVYEPVRDGGFRCVGGRRLLNRPIVHGQNRLWTGDRPVFRLDTVTGNGSYAREERVFPLWPRPDAHVGEVNPAFGTLRLGVVVSGKVLWLDDYARIETTFRPGYTRYRVRDADAGWTIDLTAAPALDCHGLICRVEADRDLTLVWQWQDMHWTEAAAAGNQVTIDGPRARLTDASLPNGESWIACDAAGELRAVPARFRQGVAYRADRPQRNYHIVATWGVTTYDEAWAQRCLKRLETPGAAAWPAARERLQQQWFDCYIKRALNPEANLARLLAHPADELTRTCGWWDQRREAFQIRTPDERLDALMNWTAATTEYHRQGPGLVLGGQIWQMYSHISTGWYGKQWAGDHAALDDCLRLYGAMQDAGGFVRWISPSLVAFNAENNTPYWVDQVWRHYTWTGDRQFVRDLWPGVRQAVAWSRTHHDPDGDGLYRDFYEYWNCDSNGKGPKSAAATAMAWAAVDRSARLAEVVGDAAAAKEYRDRADQIRRQALGQLWREDEGRLGCIGADGLWRGHPQTWEEYLAINAGLLSPEQGRRAMRWLAAHYGFQPSPGVQLLACSDWFPIRWSTQWVPTGDTCLAVLAGLKCGDADLWWPYLRTVVGSAFRSEHPGINMGISNHGAGGGDREDVDSVDPHLHVTVRGLFGVEPALPEGRLDICPAFPSTWREASLTTPDVAYTWRREGQTATFRIRTAKPLVKRVRASLGGPEVVTPAETESTVTAALGPAAPPLEPVARPTIMADREPPLGYPPLTAAEARRQVLCDLGATANQTLEEFADSRYVYDYADQPAPITGWWGNPGLSLLPSPRVVTATNGVQFLTPGRARPGGGPPAKNVLALSSWAPYARPGGAVIRVGRRCDRLWLLLCSYVHPMKNYVPNGEVVLRYDSGAETVVSLVPPFNLDCYFQHFSREGLAVPFGRLPAPPGGFSFVPPELSQAHADALPVTVDFHRALREVELRATCSEGVLGLAGLTLMVR